jgi:Holliday junction DNA helicase RuvA
VRIVDAIRGGDAGFLKQLPGLGKKTAERLVMELGDKLDDLAAAGPAPAAAGASSLRDEVVAALTSLGMTRPAAEAALEKMNWRPDSEQSVADVVREALRYAGR